MLTNINKPGRSRARAPQSASEGFSTGLYTKGCGLNKVVRTKQEKENDRDKDEEVQRIKLFRSGAVLILLLTTNIRLQVWVSSNIVFQIKKKSAFFSSFVFLRVAVDFGAVKAIQSPAPPQSLGQQRAAEPNDWKRL